MVPLAIEPSLFVVEPVTPLSVPLVASGLAALVGLFRPDPSLPEPDEPDEPVLPAELPGLPVPELSAIAAVAIARLSAVTAKIFEYIWFFLQSWFVMLGKPVFLKDVPAVAKKCTTFA